jgi:hypothetical protein
MYNQWPTQMGLCVLHRCDNPPCVNPDHLYLGTRRQNSGDAVKSGLIANGERHYRAKLSVQNVRTIRADYQVGHTLKKLAERFGVSVATVFAIVNHKSWASVGD